MYYHGLTKGPIKGKPVTPFFFTSEEMVARAYGPVVNVGFFTKKPLILDSPASFEEAWNEGGSDLGYMMHPDKTSRFTSWAIKKGYDIIVITPNAFKGFNKAYFTVGNPQVIALKDNVWIG